MCTEWPRLVLGYWGGEHSTPRLQSKCLASVPSRHPAKTCYKFSISTDCFRLGYACAYYPAKNIQIQTGGTLNFELLARTASTSFPDLHTQLLLACVWTWLTNSHVDGGFFQRAMPKYVCGSKGKSKRKKAGKVYVKSSVISW